MANTHRPFGFSSLSGFCQVWSEELWRPPCSDLQKKGGMEKQTVRVVNSTWMLRSREMAYWGASRVMQGRQLKRLGYEVGEVEKDIQGKNGREVELESAEVVESETEMDGTIALTGGLLITVLLMIWGKSGNEEIGSEMAEISAAVVSTGTVKMSSIACRKKKC